MVKLSKKRYVPHYCPYCSHALTYTITPDVYNCDMCGVTWHRVGETLKRVSYSNNNGGRRPMVRRKGNPRFKKVKRKGRFVYVLRKKPTKKRTVRRKRRK